MKIIVSLTAEEIETGEIKNADPPAIEWLDRDGWIKRTGLSDLKISNASKAFLLEQINKAGKSI